jgi:hypothetical protein
MLSAPPAVALRRLIATQLQVEPPLMPNSFFGSIPWHETDQLPTQTATSQPKNDALSSVIDNLLTLVVLAALALVIWFVFIRKRVGAPPAVAAVPEALPSLVSIWSPLQ